MTALASGRYAAIDIGTVTCRMLIADVDGDTERITDVAKEYTICNLGEGVDATGRLSDAAMQRVYSTIERYLNVLEGFNTPENPVCGLLTMATSASRDAENADEFRSLMSRIGAALDVIPGQKEASLTFLGVSNDFPGENLLVADVGGGSTELVVGRAGQRPLAIRSLNVGCRRVTERFLTSDPPAKSQISESRQWIHTQLQPFFTGSGANASDLDRLVAVAGTATSVVSMREGMEAYDPSRVHKAFVTAEQLRAIKEKLAAEPLATRRETVGLDPKRADVIVAGLVILEEVLELSNMPGFTVSESDILHGMILEMAQR